MKQINNFLLASSHDRSVPGGLSGAPGIDLTIEKVFNIIAGLACYITQLALIAIVIALIWYGLKFMASRGDPGKFNEAKKYFNYGLLGIVIILGAYTIIATVANAIDPSAEYTYFVPLNCGGY